MLQPSSATAPSQSPLPSPPGLRKRIPLPNLAKLIPAEHLLAFIQQTVVRLPQALQELTEDPASLVLQARVVGLLVGGMASTTGHRKCIFMGMTEGNVQRAEAYKSTFTITVPLHKTAKTFGAGKVCIRKDLFQLLRDFCETDVVLPFEERAKVSQAMAHDLQTARKCYVPEATAQQARGTALNILKSLMTSVNQTKEPMQTVEEADQQGQTQAQGILKDDLEVSTSSDDSEDEEGKTMDQETLAESEVSESADSSDFEDEGQVKEVMVQGQEQAQSESCSSEPDSNKQTMEETGQQERQDEGIPEKAMELDHKTSADYEVFSKTV
ncbi:unnamed protein product [Merluccius merluccius]